MSGRRSRDKGARTERAIVHLLQARGFAAEKISGMYKPGSDISIPLLGSDRKTEVKCRQHGFAQLYTWLQSAEILIVKADRSEPLVILPLRLAIEIAAVAEQRKNSR
jgi:Holliday junction resolvase